jgi:hypothetical protein
VADVVESHATVRREAFRLIRSLSFRPSFFGNTLSRAAPHRDGAVASRAADDASIDAIWPA